MHGVRHYTAIGYRHRFGELATLEERLLASFRCARRAEEIAAYVDAMRAAARQLERT